MKTIKKDGAIKRYSDERAASLVRTEGWEYTSKSEWKSLVRDINKPPRGEEKENNDDVTNDVDVPKKSRKFYKTKKRQKMARKEEKNG
jgi:hypothetical protein